MASLSEVLANKKASNVDQVSTLPRARQPEGRQTLGAISYTQTRVLTLNRTILRENRIISALAGEPVVDAYKILCIQVLQQLRASAGNAVAIVSPGDDEGKTLTAVNLAISLAQEVDQTVLLVDANLRDPAIHKYFGFRPEVGLSSYLIDGVSVEQLLINPGIDRLVVLPGGRPLQNSTEMLGSIKMATLVTELKSRYPSRIVLFDLPPVLSIADALAFAPYVDAALMVVQENKTSRAEIQRAAEMLKGVRLLGTVLNMAAEAAVPEEDVSTSWWRRLLGKRQ
ncbi:MAG TPA: CpsD/CapB family tyrosine-protein kinase [Rhodocyclaceae bacterium]|nr:CpsD/CapB family tyrosine-protein kinase [Rhodocyclaceae bacterium]